MSWPSRPKILFCVQVFFGLCNAIVSSEGILNSMSPEERKSIFGTEDGSTQECEVVEFVRPSRSKRSGKQHVNITIDAFGQFITATLNVVEDDDLINRSRTGIWAAHRSRTAYQNVSYYPWPYIFETVGNFEFLQNAEEGSAITRFWDSDGTEKIAGVLKQIYTVKTAPRGSDNVFINISEKYVREERSVNSMNDQDKKQSFLTICKNAPVPQEYFRHHTYAKIGVRPDPNLHRPKRQFTNVTKRPDVVYPKLLIIPDHRTVNRHTYVREFMRQLIAFLNSIDMIFRQLKAPEVHLTIAGIIIPSEDASTPYMSKHMNAQNQIMGARTLLETQRHFHNEWRRFPPDESDVILMLTTNPGITYYDPTGNQVRVDGLGSGYTGCYGATAIATFNDNIQSIVTVARVLGGRFGANRDHAERECNGVNGYLIGNQFPAKFEWSNCSRAAFQTFFRSRAQTCNYYRRWRVPNAVMSMPGPWFSIEGQCDNLYNDSTGYCISKRSPECFIYGCVRNETCDWTLNLPPEGKLLFNADDELQACINGTMVNV